MSFTHAFSNRVMSPQQVALLVGLPGDFQVSNEDVAFVQRELAPAAMAPELGLLYRVLACTFPRKPPSLGKEFPPDTQCVEAVPYKVIARLGQQRNLPVFTHGAHKPRKFLVVRKDPTAG